MFSLFMLIASTLIKIIQNRNSYIIVATHMKIPWKYSSIPDLIKYGKIQSSNKKWNIEKQIKWNKEGILLFDI